MGKNLESKNSIKGMLMLGTCALIWGTAFIAQSIGGEYAEPFTFNFARSALAMFFLLICCIVFDKLAGKKFTFWGTKNPIRRERLLKGGILCGLALGIGIFLQQLGIMYTTVGKSGFITALYIVLVPLLSFLFLKRHINYLQWFSVAVASIGMYFICINESFTINKGDLYTLIAAFCFAGQIVCVDKIITNLDGVRLSLIQFITCTIFNGIFMLFFEEPSITNLMLGWLPIAYAGIMSSGVAFTLQIVGQKDCNPVIACMILSLESVFALLSGWIILGQVMTSREIFGCILVFAAILLVQIPQDVLKRKK